MNASGASGRPLLALGASTMSVVLAALPVFLLGALAVFIRDELGFSEVQLGVTVSLYYLTSAIASAPSGRWAERLGARRGMALAALIDVAALLLMAATVRSWLGVTLVMQVAALVNGLSLSASNLGLLAGVQGRRGLAFGLKQSSGPIATLLAGASVPLVALSVGWRWAFVAAACFGLPLVVAGRRRPVAARTHVRGAREDLNVSALRVLATSTGLAVVGGSSVGAFYVESAVSNGISPGTAGTMLAVGSASGIVGRVVWGWLGDRAWSHHFVVLTAILGVGAIGFVLLGQVSGLAVLAVVTILVFTCGWGWPGLFYHAITARSPRAPAVASGIVATGIYAGGIGGPVVFGALVERFSYDVAWLFVGVAMVASTWTMWLGGRMLSSAPGAGTMTAPVGAA